MPELPEVETVKNTLKKYILNRTIHSIEILYPRMIQNPLDEFKNCIINSKIIDIQRKGKFLIFILDNDYVMISHLRMEGKYLSVNENDNLTKHTRVIFHLDNNQKLLYDDSRKFGIMQVFKKNEYLSNLPLSKLGPEPFDCNEHYLFNQLKNNKNEIKTALLDQSIIAGLGNIYVDETLFVCKINPYRKANSLTIKECKNILINSRLILNRSIEKGGSTVSSYHPDKGVDGKFQIELLAYGKEGTNCPNCQHLLRKDFCQGRGTVYCPHCQKVSLKIGIYGKIAAGKSTLLSYLKSLGYQTFSSDEVVKKIYTTLEAKKFFIDLFGEEVLNDNGLISKNFIKNKITHNSEIKKKIEDFIHPLVKKEAIKFINTYRQEKLIFIEVPLMFEARFNALMDYIIGIDASLPSQLEHLRLRGSKNPNLDLKLNDTNKFDRYASKCEYLVSNNGTLEDLYHQCDSIINDLLTK